MQYNSLQKKLVMPEYGRNVQSMVDHALTIEDKAERTRCANSIINIMGILFPHLRDVEDFKHKLWDHLAIMADFKLDIDYTYDIIKKENLITHPEKVPYSFKRIKYRHYGKYVEDMIQKLGDIQDLTERNQLISLIGNHMKRSFLSMTFEKDVEDDKICKDINEYNRNADIIISVDTLKLRGTKDIIQRKSKNSMKRAVR